MYSNNATKETKQFTLSCVILRITSRGSQEAKNILTNEIKSRRISQASYKGPVQAGVWNKDIGMGIIKNGKKHNKSMKLQCFLEA